MRLPRRSFCAAFVFALILSCSFAQETPLKNAAITDSDLDACLAINLPTWKQRLAAQPHPRMVFTGPAAIARFKEAMQHPDTEQARLLNQLKTAADELVTAPVVKYRSPEEIAQAGKTSAWHAQAELWERPVGDSMITLALAGLLWDSPQYKARLKQVVLEACHYPSWGIGDHGQANDDLTCDHMARGIAIAYDWHPNLWTHDDAP